ncbi:MAG: nitroreductase [Solobacterium sp.]|nr:nitroreductase [Solobacterium sp.]
MSDFYDVILNRASTKSFKPDPVPEDVLGRILEAGKAAPSGMGKQAAVILAVTNKEVRDEISRLNAAVMHSDKDPFYGAPVVLVVLADKSVATHVYDGSVVMENLLLAARAEGLGCCWIHRAKEVFDTPEGKKILKDAGIEGDYEGVGNCILGYSTAEPAVKPKKENYVFCVK